MDKKINIRLIIEKLSHDDESAVDTLFNFYYPRLFNFSKSFLKFENGIDDIIQEVFIKIWQNRKKINDPSTFNSYIFTITRNLLLNELRRYINNQDLKEEIRKVSIAPEYLVSEQIEYGEFKNKIKFIIEELPDRQKEIFKLSRYKGLSHKEIAEKLKITTKTVEYHISLATNTLKTKLYCFGFLYLLYFYLFL